METVDRAWFVDDYNTVVARKCSVFEFAGLSGFPDHQIVNINHVVT